MRVYFVLGIVFLDAEGNSSLAVANAAINHNKDRVVSYYGFFVASEGGDDEAA